MGWNELRSSKNSNLDDVSADTERASNPEEHGKPTKQIFGDLDPFWRRSRWSELVRTVLLVVFGCGGTGQPFLEICVEPLAEYVDVNGMNVKHKFLLQAVNSFT